MQKVKAVFFDFDWTLFDHKTRSFIDSAIASINAVHNDGTKTFINSARTYYALKKLGTFEKIAFDGFAVNNGGAAFTRDKLIYAKYLEPSVAKSIIDTARAHGFSYLIVTLKNAYIEAKEGDENVPNFYKVYYEPRPLDMDLYENDEPILSIQLFITKEHDHLFDHIPGSVFNRFFDCAVELTREWFHKDEGIKALIQDYGYGKDELAAFGDDYNDVDMFNLVGNGICMGNGVEEVKKKAKWVTTPIEQDGIKNGLAHLDLFDK